MFWSEPEFTTLKIWWYGDPWTSSLISPVRCARYPVASPALPEPVPTALGICGDVIRHLIAELVHDEEPARFLRAERS
jgi:hypothetical protein